ncbi:TPA: hypothetical protein ACWLUR_002500 [Enterococcus faecalis]
MNNKDVKFLCEKAGNFNLRDDCTANKKGTLAPMERCSYNGNIQPLAEYANFKTLRCYVNSIFNWAEELEYIERNKLAKSLKRIKATKKNQLKGARQEEDKYLSFDQLQEWLNTVHNDWKNGLLLFQDYLLFQLTLFLSDRKSETCALKWKHLDLVKSQITLAKALDKFGNEKNIKGNKTIIFHIPTELKKNAD